MENGRHRNTGNKPWLYLFLIAYLLIFLAPVLYSTLYSDDIVINGVVKARSVLEHRTLASLIAESVGEWTTKGRIFPITLMSTLAIHYAFTDLLAYKSLTVVLVLANVGLFGLLVYRLTRSHAALVCTVLTLPMFLQFRYYHDPVLSFAGFLQILHLFMTGALLGAVAYLERRSPVSLAAGLLCFVLALCTYEIAYALPLAVCALVLLHSRKGLRRKVVAIAAYAAVTVMFLAITIHVRPRSENLLEAGYSGVHANLDRTLMVRTFRTQAAAAIPLVFAAQNRQFLAPYLDAELHRTGFFALLMLAPFVAAVFFRTIGLVPFSAVAGKLAVLGMILWLMPALLLSVSEKYQTELLLQVKLRGLGYLPVYIQAYGLHLVLFTACGLLLRLTPPWPIARKLLTGAMSLVVTAMILGTYVSNAAVISLSNFYIGSRLTFLRQAIDAGVLDRIPDSSRILVRVNNHNDLLPPPLQTGYSHWPYDGNWINTYSLYAYSGRKFRTYQNREEMNTTLEITDEGNPERVYLLDYEYFPEPSLRGNSMVRVLSINAGPAGRSGSGKPESDAVPLASYRFGDTR
jgi:hypothetical protein